MDIAFIEFDNGEMLHPGGSMEREMTFWWRPGLDEALHVGREWRIQEGAALVGMGTVLEVLQTYVASAP